MKHLLFSILLIGMLPGQKILIPMDPQQNDHLKAYGIAFWILERDINVEWLLNYRGRSFLTQGHSAIEQECRVRGVTFERVNATDILNIMGEIEQNNMDVVLLEKAPKIAIYTPTNKQPWDDAVTLALTYSEVPYTTLWDEEVLTSGLDQ